MTTHRFRLATAAVLALPLAALPSAASRAAETCHGLPATMVGTPGGQLSGTDGPDVIVTNGAWIINAGAGDDLVCVTGRAPQSPYISVHEGADLVDASRSASNRLNVSLGAGRDRFVGGAAAEWVTAGERRFSDHDVDVLSSGAGNDILISGTRGDVANADVVRAGSGDDRVRYLGRQVAGRVVAGAGADALNVNISGGPGATHTQVHAASRTVVRNGSVWLRWQGAFATYTVVGRSADGGTFAFTGTSRGERLQMEQDGAQVVTAHLRGGKDAIEDFEPDYAAGSAFSAGPGTDRLRLNVNRNLRPWARELHVDLQENRADFTLVSTHRSIAVFGLEDVTAGAKSLTMAGDTEDNQFRVIACRTTVSGRAGADVIKADRFESCRPGRTRLEGMNGADVLRGTRLADLLLGGPGRDVADGRGGRDTCRAEVRRSCERT